jgi:hypothetical protein
VVAVVVLPEQALRVQPTQAAVVVAVVALPAMAVTADPELLFFHTLVRNAGLVERLRRLVVTQFILLTRLALSRRKSWLLKSKTSTICNFPRAQRLNARRPRPA